MREPGKGIVMQDPKIDKKKMLAEALSTIEKAHGKGAIMRLGENSTQPVDVIPTGSLGVDIALGTGGVPRGRIVEIYGPESSGKTTLSLSVIAQAQKLGGICAFVDAEHALDVSYAKKLGVKIEDILISQPDNGEQALEIAETLIRSNSIDVLVIDSVAALVPRAEIEGEMGDSLPGLQARLMSQAMRKLNAAVARSRTTLIFINQLRQKIGVMFGNPETTSGGNALKFYASVRIDIRRIGAIKQGETVVGNRTRAKIVKNKLAPPFRESEFDLLFGEGPSRMGDILDMGSEINVLQKTGSWYSFGTERIGQGREQAIAYLKEHPEIGDEVERKILENYGIVRQGAAGAAAAAAASKDADEPGSRGDSRSDAKAGASGKTGAPARKTPKEEIAEA